MLEVRALVRLYVDLLGEHTGWLQRLHATLFHMGPRSTWAQLTAGAAHRRVLSAAGRDAVDTGMRQVDRLTADLTRCATGWTGSPRRQPGCRALQSHYGIGPLTGVAIWEELGDTRRFPNSAAAVRHAGLDITVYSSDTTRSPRAPVPARPSRAALGAISRPRSRRQRHSSPDHAYYQQVKTPARRPRATVVRRPQTRPPLPPHPAQPRRSGVGARVAGLTRRRADAHHLVNRGQLQTSHAAEYTRTALYRPSGRTPFGNTHPPSCDRSPLRAPR